MAALLLLNLWSCVIGEAPPDLLTVKKIDGNFYFDIAIDHNKYEYACAYTISVDRFVNFTRQAPVWWASDHSKSGIRNDCQLKLPIIFGTGGSGGSPPNMNLSSGCYYVDAEIYVIENSHTSLERFAAHFCLDSELNLTEQEREHHDVMLTNGN
jgi:hypothetical protein